MIRSLGGRYQSILFRRCVFASRKSRAAADVASIPASVAVFANKSLVAVFPCGLLGPFLDLSIIPLDTFKVDIVMIISAGSRIQSGGSAGDSTMTRPWALSSEK